ncbi:MAG TPA: hypothetical protein VMV27_00670, partial [Candidatus Binataceae bacterium]|nr:hypothetical protein [Candidatus Binataceae bacterium]
GGGGRGAAINGHTDAAAMAADVEVSGGGSGGSGGGGSGNLLVSFGQALESLWNDIYGGLFGGGPSLPPNYFVFQARLERAGRHPQYDQIMKIARQLILTQASPVWELFSGPGTIPPNVPPLLRADYSGQIIRAGSQSAIRSVAFTQEPPATAPGAGGCRQAARRELAECVAVFEAPSDIPKAAAIWGCLAGGEESGGLACSGFIAMEIPSTLGEAECIAQYRMKIVSCR